VTRVLHVSTSLGLGGAERMLSSLVTSGSREPVAHTVVSLIPGGAYADRLREAGIPVTELPIGPWPPNPWPVTTLARLIRAARPDVVQGWMYHGDLVATLALLLSGRRRQTRLAWTLQCSRMDTRHYHRQLRAVIRLCAALSRQADIVVSNSAAGIASHIALGYRPRRTRIIYPGIDTERFRPDQASAPSVRHEIALPAGAPVVAHVARLDPMKDHACLLKAMQYLPDVRVLAIGPGTEALPALPGLHRLGPRDDVERLLTACDASVSSSAFGEGFPNSLAESMAVGVPVAATDVGDTSTIVGDTGCVVPPRSPEPLADAIRLLLRESPETRRSRGSRARARVVTHFGRPRMVEEFTRLYQELVGDGADGQAPSGRTRATTARSPAP
jgi:glycosyltransferase involved in cell wall biosynthesis